MRDICSERVAVVVNREIAMGGLQKDYRSLAMMLVNPLRGKMQDETEVSGASKRGTPA